MRANGLLRSLLAVAFLFITISAAWPGQGAPANGLARRQDEEQPSSTASDSTTATDDAPAVTSTGNDNNDDNNDGNNDSSSDDSNSSTDEGDNSSASGDNEPTNTRNATRTTAIDPRLPPGGVQMVTPGPLEGSQYYKIGDYVTFAWNYTSLSITPSAIDILVSCSLNSATYTISSNMSVEETGRIIWDTGESATATNPFPVATYTLIIHDSSKDITDVPQAGYLGSYNQYQFGMYTPQPYVPLNEFRCATCNNGALSTHERQALGVLLGTVAITILSFTWFANGFGAFS
jgi:hypothetical protein